MKTVWALLAVFLLSKGAAQTPLERATALAAAGLTQNIASVPGDAGTKEYVLAGAHQYYWFWARDFSWSVPGLLAAGKAAAVRDTLDLVFGLQRADGLLPRDVCPDDFRIRYVLGYLGFRRPFKPPFFPTFVSENGIVTLDTNVIVPWAASVYVLTQKDKAAAQRWWPAAEKAVAFLEKNYGDDGLIGRQPPFSDWEDSVARTGKVAYTNELYVMALRGLSDWAGFLGKTEAKAEYARRAQAARERFLRVFWSPERKMIRNFDGDEHLSADANLIAVVHRLVAPEQAREIMAALRAGPIWTPLPGRATTPDLPDSMKSFLPRLSGNKHYHDSQHWLWLGAYAALAEREAGNARDCEDILDGWSKIIVRDQAVCENYTDSPDGATVVKMRSWLYRSECPLTWSAATFLQAAKTGCAPSPRL